MCGGSDPITAGSDVDATLVLDQGGGEWNPATRNGYCYAVSTTLNARWLPGDTFRDVQRNIQIHVDEDYGSGFVVYSFRGQPPVPGQPSITSSTNNAISLQWTAGIPPFGDVSRFDVRYCTVAAVPTCIAVPVGPGVRTWDHVGLLGGEGYNYTVRACWGQNSPVCSDWSLPTFAETQFTEAPQNFRITDVDLTSVDLAWNDLPNEDRYDVRGRVWNLGGDVMVAMDEPPWQTWNVGDVTAWEKTGTVPGQYWEFQARGCRGLFCGPYSNVAWTYIHPVPARPTALFTTNTASSLTVHWTDAATNESEYQVYWAIDNGGPLTFTKVVLPQNSTFYTLSPATPGQWYLFFVYACNDTGCNPYDPSIGIYGRIENQPPPPPSGVHAGQVTGASVQLLWQDGSSETYYWLAHATIRNGVLLGGGHTWEALPAGTTSYSVGGLLPADQVDFYLSACNGAGCSAGVHIVLQATAPVPLPPVALHFLSNAITSQAIAWSPGDGTADYFSIRYTWYQANGQPYLPWSTAAGAGTTFTNGNLAANTYWEYWVRACNEGGCSAEAGIGGATPPPPPSVPANLWTTYTQFGGPNLYDIYLQWSDSGNETGYWLSYRYWLNGAPATAWSQELGLTANTQIWRHAGLGHGAHVEYALKACNASGCSAWAYAAQYTPPDEPPYLGFWSVTPTAITIYWGDVANETMYRIAHRRAGQAWLTSDIGANQTFFTHQGLTPGEVYDYAVYACNPADCSTPTSYITAITPWYDPLSAAALTSLNSAPRTAADGSLPHLDPPPAGRHPSPADPPPALDHSPVSATADLRPQPLRSQGRPAEPAAAGSAVVHGPEVTDHVPPGRPAQPPVEVVRTAGARAVPALAPAGLTPRPSEPARYGAGTPAEAAAARARFGIPTPAPPPPGRRPNPVPVAVPPSPTPAPPPPARLPR